MDSFQLDWELYKHENLEDSPYFVVVNRAIDRIVNQGPHPPEEVVYFYVDFANILLNLGITSAWIPKLLDSFKSGKEAYSCNSNFVDTHGWFNYHYCKMKYYFLKGGKCNQNAIKHGMEATSLYENDSLMIETDPDNNDGKSIQDRVVLMLAQQGLPSKIRNYFRNQNQQYE